MAEVDEQVESLDNQFAHCLQLVNKGYESQLHSTRQCIAGQISEKVAAKAEELRAAS